MTQEGGHRLFLILVWPPTREGTALLPTALVFVSNGFVLVQVQVLQKVTRRLSVLMLFLSIALSYSLLTSIQEFPAGHIILARCLGALVLWLEHNSSMLGGAYMLLYR